MNNLKATAIAVLMSLSFPLLAVEWQGTVVGVSDGDTLTVLTNDKKQIKIRLTEIDAPEKAQAFGQQSKQSLSDMCFGKDAVINDKGQDRYKRVLGRVTCAGVDANAEQVKLGLAWAYTQYLTDQSIAQLEAAAKASRIGLWADENPTPPWEFRHSGKVSKASKPSVKSDLTSSGFKCGGKSRCGDMDSCAEARFYLTQCGMGRLDRDNDGIPCESICR